MISEMTTTDTPTTDPHDEVRTLALNFSQLSPDASAWFMALPPREKKHFIERVKFAIYLRAKGRLHEGLPAPTDATR